MKRDNVQYILHRILWVRDHDYVICSDNQLYPERRTNNKLGNATL